MHTDQPQAERLGIRDTSNRHHRVCSRDIRLAHKLQQRCSRVCGLDTAAKIDHRALRLSNHRGHCFQLFLRDIVGLMDLDLLAGDIFALRTGDILGDINQDRAGTAGCRDTECTADGVRQLLHVAHNKVMLGDRHGDTGDIHLLERVAPDQAGTDVAGDGNHRDGIHVSCGNARDQVGRPRAGSRQAYADPAGRAGIAVRRVGGTLLMGCQNMSNAVAVLVKRIIDIEDCAARVAENRINALLDQCLHQNL